MRSIMNTKALYFELTSIFLILALGLILLSINLPGWGLIAVAAALLVLSCGLRLTPAVAAARSR